MKPHPATKLWSLGTDNRFASPSPHYGHDWETALREHHAPRNEAATDLSFVTKLNDVKSILGVK